MSHIYSEVWRKRSIIWDFAILDLKIRYKNSVLGFAWNFIEPLLLLLVLYIVFSSILKTNIENFPLYLLLGLILWQMLDRGSSFGLNSTLSKGSILTQINIPAVVPPISAALTSLIMLTFELIIFGIFLVAFQFVPPLTILILPLIVLLEFVLVLGLALPLSVLNIKFRDIQFIWVILIRAGFFLHPIFYRSEILPEEIQSILVYSPMVQILNLARDVTLYGELPTTENLIIALGTTFVIFVLGYGIFKKLSSRIIEEL